MQTGYVHEFLGKQNPPTLVLGETEPPIAYGFGSSRRVLPPLTRALGCTRASLWVEGARCAHPDMRAPGACILNVERYARLAYCAHLGQLLACDAFALVEKFTPFG